MSKKPRASLVIAAFAAVYLIWGSTYLGIKLAIATLPPLVSMGARHLLAGAILWAILPGPWPRPTRRDWLWAVLLGGLLLLAGNGIVAVVEEKMPSSVAALLITSVPLWMVLLEWLFFRGGAPGPLVVAALVLGFAGVGLLAGNADGWTGGEVDFRFVAGILFGCLCWATGSLLARKGGIKLPLLRSVALQMLCGGALLLLFGFTLGESVDLAAVTAESWLAWLYLVLFGSVVAFSAYSWLIATQPSALVSTYAFVNPVVAVLLGAWWLDEPLGPRTLLASALIIAAVALVTYAKARQRAASAPHPKPTE